MPLTSTLQQIGRADGPRRLKRDSGPPQGMSSVGAMEKQPSLPMRIWARTPDWLFRAIGALFFFSILCFRLPDYFHNFWNLGTRYVFENGDRLSFPWTRLLIDFTGLQIALSYLFRVPAETRASRAGDVVIGLLGGFWPMLPFLTLFALSLYDPGLGYTYFANLWNPSPSLFFVLTATALIVVGNALDIWGYGVLFRSFSIVPEARQLKVNGIYRFVRHPIYLGQILAQAGVWLFLARINLFSVSFLALFVALQLYRSKLEDRVLENAFGERYRAWKARTFWFV